MEIQKFVNSSKDMATLSNQLAPIHLIKMDRLNVTIAPLATMCNVHLMEQTETLNSGHVLFVTNCASQMDLLALDNDNCHCKLL